MKQLVFLLLVLSATTSFAKDCIEALWKSAYLANIGNPDKEYLDSVYSITDGIKQEGKYFWSKGLPDSVIIFQEDTLYSKVAYTTVFSGDTIKENASNLSEQQESESWMTKNHKHIVLKTKSQITITDEYLKNDSIISTNKVILDDDTSDAFIYTYTKSADNPLKCQTVSSVTKNDTIEMIFEYNDTEKGFVEKASIIEDNEIQNYTESYYIIPDKSPSGTTVIRRKTPRTGISSKAKYFDLLGRYKFVK